MKRLLPSLNLILLTCMVFVGCNIQSQSNQNTTQPTPQTTPANPTEHVSPTNTKPIKCEPCAKPPKKPVTTTQLAEIVKFAKQGKVLNQSNIKLTMTQSQIEALASSNHLKRVHDFEFITYDQPYYTEIFFFEDLVNGIRYSSPSLGINTLSEIKKYLGTPTQEYMDEYSKAKEIIYQVGKYHIKFRFTHPSKYVPDPALYSYQIFESM